MLDCFGSGTSPWTPRIQPYWPLRRAFVDSALGLGLIAVSGLPLHLHLQHAVVTFNHVSPTHAAGGVIAGVVATKDLVAAVQAIAGNISSSLCAANTFAQIAASIEQASDILVDGSNPAGKPCDAISVGIGFEAEEIQNPQFAGTLPSPADPCGGG